MDQVVGKTIKVNVLNGPDIPATDSQQTQVEWPACGQRLLEG